MIRTSGSAPDAFARSSQRRPGARDGLTREQLAPRTADDHVVATALEGVDRMSGQDLDARLAEQRAELFGDEPEVADPGRRHVQRGDRTHVRLVVGELSRR